MKKLELPEEAKELKIRKGVYFYTYEDEVVYIGSAHIQSIDIRTKQNTRRSDSGGTFRKNVQEELSDTYPRVKKRNLQTRAIKYVESCDKYFIDMSNCSASEIKNCERKYIMEYKPKYNKNGKN